MLQGGVDTRTLNGALPFRVLANGGPQARFVIDEITTIRRASDAKASTSWLGTYSFDVLRPDYSNTCSRKRLLGAKDGDGLATSAVNPRVLIRFAYYNADQAWPFGLIRE